MKSQVCKARALPKSKKIKKKSKRKRKKSFGLNFQILVYCALLIGVGLCVYQPLIQRVDKGKEICVLQENIVKLQKENEILEQEASALNSDDYVEEVARQDLGLVKQGEESYIVIPETGREEELNPWSPDANSDKKNLKQPLWQQISEFIVNIIKR